MRSLARQLYVELGLWRSGAERIDALRGALPRMARALGMASVELADQQDPATGECRMPAGNASA